MTLNDIEDCFTLDCIDISSMNVDAHIIGVMNLTMFFILSSDTTFPLCYIGIQFHVITDLGSPFWALKVIN